jgi:hypothetical protein
MYVCSRAEPPDPGEGKTVHAGEGSVDTDKSGIVVRSGTAKSHLDKDRAARCTAVPRRIC